MSADQQRPLHDSLDEQPHAFAYEAERVDGVAGPQLIAVELSVQQIRGLARGVVTLGPAPGLVVAGNGDEQDRNALREVLANPRIVQRIDEELIPVRRPPVDICDRGEARNRLIWYKVQGG